MTFQFTPITDQPELGDHCYELPGLPYGTSYSLTKLVAAYSEAVRNGPDDADEVAYEPIDAFAPTCLSDVIAKLLMQLHYDNRGLDRAGRLILAVTERRHGQILKAQGLLSDLYGQLPQDWHSAVQAYRAALVAETDFDRRVWNVAYEAMKQGGPAIPAAADAEIERLQNARWNAEHFLLEMPAPTFGEFAIKYLICFANDRDQNGYHDQLCAEALRLLGKEADPEADEAEAILHLLNWRFAA